MTKITFLGTGTSQGVPLIACTCRVCASGDPRDKRLRSSVLIEFDDLTLSIDAGPDFRQQMLRYGVDRLDAILLTHDHKDHIGGLDDVRAFNYVMGKPMDIYAEPNVLDTVRSDFSYAFAEKLYPGVPQFSLHSIGEEPFEIGRHRIVPIRGIHYRLPVLGFRIGRFAYLTDMNRIECDSIEKLRGLDVLVINALRRKTHLSHFSLAQALEVIAKTAPGRAYLTHISHEMGLYGEIENECADRNIFFAYDGLKITTDE